MSPGDSELGEQLILSRETKPAPFKLFLQSEFYWTNNLYAAPSDTDDSLFWFNAAELSWRPSLGNGFVLDTFINAQSFVFQHDSALNFESFMLGLGIVKVIPELDGLVVFGRYEFQNIELDRGITPNPASYHRLRFGAYKEILDTRRHGAYLSLGARFDLDSDPSSVSRNEYAFRAGYSYALTDRLSAGAFYRIGRRNFENIDRDDTFHMIGSDLTYNMSKALTLTASALWTENDSDNSPFAQDYHSLQFGIALNYQINF